jgi:DNA-binding beta-propeller fold protein YncE
MNLTAATKLAAALPLALALSAAAQPVEFGPPYSIAGGFENPFGVAVDPAQGHLLVTDTRNRQIQWATLSSLAASPAFRSFGYVADTTSPSALFDPQGMAVDRAGHVYVVDAKRNQVNLYTWSPGSGTYELDSTFASATRNTVAGTAIESPRAVATAPDGKVYMLDSGRKRVLRADGPADTTWEVFISDATLGNAYGIGVGPDGRVYVADTDHHRILRYESNGSSTAFGRFGGGAGEFSYPRDIAIGTDGRLYVADTGNHRIAVLDDSGRYLYAMGRAPAVGFVQKVAVGAGPKLFAADSDRNIVIAYLGRGTAAPYDGWLRDFVGDTGTEPSSSAFTPSSPDVLVRSLADVDAAAANVSGLETVSFQNPRFGTDNQVYVAVRNRGRQELRDAVALLYWADPAGGLAFPADWRTTGFFAGPGSASASDRLEVPPLAPGASAVLGPLRFLPPSPDSSQFNNGAFLLGVRILNSFDYAPAGTGLAAVRASNNVAIRPIKVTRGPFAIGDQNTLVVRADFPDVAGSASEAFVQERISDADAWINSVSYGKTRLRPLFVGPITLDQPKSYYDDPTSSHLIELTTEVLNKVLAANPGVLDGPTPDPSDDIGRIVVVLNDPALAKDWASTGSWPYLVGGTTRYLSTSIHGASDTAAQFAHGISHQLGLKDLYVHDNVNADPGLIDAVSRWDNMARPFEGAHPVVWSKQLATWVTSANGRILYIRRPPRGTPPRVGEPAIPMNYQSTLASGGYAAIAIGFRAKV